MSRGVTDALQQARRLELDGAEYYMKLAGMCSTMAGRRMFESFAKDERRHLRIVDGIAKGLGVDVESMPMPRDAVRTLFAEAGTEFAHEREITAGELEAVRKAMAMETASYNLYKAQAQAAKDDAARKLYERLATEENQHYTMLENTLEYLNANDQWFLWTEGALIVGDKSSLGLD